MCNIQLKKSSYIPYLHKMMGNEILIYFTIKIASYHCRLFYSIVALVNKDRESTGFSRLTLCIRRGKFIINSLSNNTR